MKEYKIENNTLFFECPSCSDFVIVMKDEINCSIFRHGVYKDSGMQIDPHMPKEQCEKLHISNMIYGCSNPFKIIIKNGDYFNVIKCEYI